MKPRWRMLIPALCCGALMACSEPSSDAILLVDGILVDPAERPIRGQSVFVRLEGEKQVDHFSARSDSVGEFRMVIPLQPGPSWFNRLVVAYHQRPCSPWGSYEASYELGNEQLPPLQKLTVRLVAPEKPAGTLTIGEMCGSSRQPNTDLAIGLAIDQLTEADSVFGRSIINYSLSTRSDLGLFAGVRIGDSVALELTGDGTGSCQGVFQAHIRFLGQPNVTTAQLVPPTPCVIREDSMRLVTEPFSLLSGF